jgi:hypothetical protein
VLAGDFLSGRYGALALHAATANTSGAIAVALTVAAVLLWKPGGGPGWPALAFGALIVAEGAQIGMGWITFRCTLIQTGTDSYRFQTTPGIPLPGNEVTTQQPSGDSWAAARRGRPPSGPRHTGMTAQDRQDGEGPSCRNVSKTASPSAGSSGCGPSAGCQRAARIRNVV